VNYLAHAVLSFDDPEILAGNMISDFIKGKKKFDYPPRILAGINLHREIDTFTDTHPVTKASASIFRSHYGLYCYAFTDVAYDHFLAISLASEGQDKFKKYTQDIYSNLLKLEDRLPDRFTRMLPHMISKNWLYNYQYDYGIEKSFGGLVHRASYISDSATAFLLFKKHYNQLKDNFHEFFPQLRNFSLMKFSEIH
jgi:acyl carrier protein phosphodiesterase